MKKKKKPLADLPTLLSKRESHKGSRIKRGERNKEGQQVGSASSSPAGITHC